MKRILPFLALLAGCETTPQADVPSPVSGAAPPATVAPVTADPQTADATPAAGTADSGSGTQPARVLADDCMGESCSSRFPAVACREVQLRTAASDTAALGATVAQNDTVDVTQSDLHLEAPGVIVFKKAWVYDKVDVDGEIMPATDTLHFAEGDTLYLIRYLSLGGWTASVRGKPYEISDGFWFADDRAPGYLGSSRRDSSIAVARSYPKIATWWHVSLRDGRRGFWKFDGDRWREGLKPEGKYWEFNCQGKD